MLSSVKVRPSMKITLDDIFLDYNGERKELLMNRARLALEDQEKRMTLEIENNNLANLQAMLKKQQTLKRVEEKVVAKEEEI